MVACPHCLSVLRWLSRCGGSVPLWPSMSGWWTYSLGSVAVRVTVEGVISLRRTHSADLWQSELAWMLSGYSICAQNWISWLIITYKAKAKNTPGTTKRCKNLRGGVGGRWPSW